MRNQVSGKTKQGEIRRIRKADIVLIVGCLLVSVLIGIFFAVHREAGSTIHILYDGMELTEIVLNASNTYSGAEAGNGYYLIVSRDDAVNVEYFKDKPKPKLAEGTNYNLISVEGGTVVMEDADCADLICVHHKPIFSKGESIICLPHRLVVEIDGRNTTINVQDRTQGGNGDDMLDEPLDGVVR